MCASLGQNPKGDLASSIAECGSGGSGSGGPVCEPELCRRGVASGMRTRRMGMRLRLLSWGRPGEPVSIPTQPGSDWAVRQGPWPPHLP